MSRTKNTWRLGIVLAGWLAASSARATIRFELPELNVVLADSGPTVSAFHVVVRAGAADLPQSVGGFNVQLLAGSAQLALGPPQEPTTPLLTSGALLDFSPGPQNLRAAKDIFPAGAALYDNAALIRVPFSVPAGVTGSFGVTFGSANQLASQAGPPITISLADTGLVHVIHAADFNVDGVVDDVDFEAWKIGFGIYELATRAQGDANDDGDSDGEDFLILQRRYGATLPNLSTTAAPVPEPAAGALFAAACLRLRRQQVTANQRAAARKSLTRPSLSSIFEPASLIRSAAD